MRSIAPWGSNLPCGNTRVSPTTTPRIRVCTPPTWNSGAVSRATLGGAPSRSCGSRLVMASSECRPEMIERCESTTALGNPVLPEVNRIRAGSFSSPPPARSGRGPPVSPAMGHDATGVPAGSLDASRLSASTARGCSNAKACSISRVLHHELTRTGTAPSHRGAQTLTTQSGPFHPSSATRSPGPIPCCCSWAALRRTAVTRSAKSSRKSPCTTWARPAQRPAWSSRDARRRVRGSYMR